jgi:hypothetical protein
LARFFSFPIAAGFFRYVCLQSWILRIVYKYTNHPKFIDILPEDADRMVNVEIWLWRNNDVRTYMYTTTQFLNFNNCDRKVDLPVWHVGVKNDHFFDNTIIEQHLRIIFNDYYGMTVNLGKHAPTVIADVKDAAPFIPAKLRRKLARP